MILNLVITVYKVVLLSEFCRDKLMTFTFQLKTVSTADVGYLSTNGCLSAVRSHVCVDRRESLTVLEFVRPTTMNYPSVSKGCPLKAAVTKYPNVYEVSIAPYPQQHILLCKMTQANIIKLNQHASFFSQRIKVVLCYLLVYFACRGSMGNSKSSELL